jgi:hypothetical protein
MSCTASADLAILYCLALGCSMGHTMGHTNLTTPVTSDTVPVHTPYPQVQVIPKGFTEDHSVLTPWYTINTIAHWGTLIPCYMCTFFFFSIFVYPSSFQEGCPLHCYAIYDTKAPLCYEWTLLCYWYRTRPFNGLLGLYGHLS